MELSVGTRGRVEGGDVNTLTKVMVTKKRRTDVEEANPSLS